MHHKAARILTVLAGIWLLSSSTLAGERALLSDKSLPIQEKLDQLLPDNQPQVDLAPVPQSEQPIPLESLPKIPELAKGLWCSLDGLGNQALPTVMRKFTVKSCFSN